MTTIAFATTRAFGLRTAPIRTAVCRKPSRGKMSTVSASTFFDLSAKDIDKKPFSFSGLSNQVTLIVNVASK
jgi:hypothetical protein